MTENDTSCPEPPEPQKKSKPPKKLDPPSDYALSLSAILKRGILKVWPNCNVPKVKSPIAWARTFDHMMIAQGRSYERIQAMIVWLYTENRSMEEGKTYTIQSADSLMEKFDRVEDMIAKTAKPKAQYLAREKREQEEADERRRERDAVTRERAGTGGAMAGDVLKTMGLEVVK
jgi:hypothetical protein